MAASRAALSTPWSQRDLREKIHRHVIMDTSHQFPMRLIGDMKPRCKIKSLSAAELQLVVQMPGEMHWITSHGQLGPKPGAWQSHGPCQRTGAVDIPPLDLWPALNNTAMEMSPCCCMFTIIQKRPFCIHHPSYSALWWSWETHP